MLVVVVVCVCFFVFFLFLFFSFLFHSVSFYLFLALLNMVGWLFHNRIFRSCSVAGAAAVACLSHLGYLNSSFA